MDVVVSFDDNVLPVVVVVAVVVLHFAAAEGVVVEGDPY